MKQGFPEQSTPARAASWVPFVLLLVGLGTTVVATAWSSGVSTRKRVRVEPSSGTYSSAGLDAFPPITTSLRQPGT